MVIVQAYLLLRSPLVPACLLSKYLSLKEEMSKSVGYGVVGLAAVLLGVLIVVPFVKGFLPQLDGYVDYPASVLTYAGANADVLNTYITSGNIAKLTTIQINYKNNLSSIPPTDPTYGDIQNKLMLVTLAINALNGDPTSNMIAKKIVSAMPATVPSGAGQAAPVGVVQAAPVGAGQVAPSLSVNVSKQSATLDLLKSACQSLLSETAAPLTGVATPSMMNTTAPVAAPPAMAMTSTVAAPPIMNTTGKKPLLV